MQREGTFTDPTARATVLIPLLDQLGREVEVHQPPQRVVSLVPSQTELLFDLGLGEQVVGVTKFCVHPDRAKTQCQIIGGTKKLNLEKVANLKPDFILANKEENLQEEVEWLAERFPVWTSDIATLDQAMEMIRSVGGIFEKTARADFLCQEIEFGFSELLPMNGLRTVYLIWWEPLMSVGSDTFIDDMLQRCGLRNLFTNRERYPQFSQADLREINPELILLSSEPFPFKEKHLDELHKLCPDSRIEFVDGEMFSWYGSRLELAAQYLQIFCNGLRETTSLHSDQREIV